MCLLLPASGLPVSGVHAYVSCAIAGIRLNMLAIVEVKQHASSTLALPVLV
jgi:hypothetical protein